MHHHPTYYPLSGLNAIILTAQSVSDRRPADARRSGRRQFRTGAVRLRHRGYDEGIAVSDATLYIRLSGAGKSGGMASFIKQVCMVSIYRISLYMMVGNFRRMVSTYLVHHGYCNTAEAFAHITDQPFTEDLTSIKNRQSKYWGRQIRWRVNVSGRSPSNLVFTCYSFGVETDRNCVYFRFFDQIYFGNYNVFLWGKDGVINDRPS